MDLGDVIEEGETPAPTDVPLEDEIPAEEPEVQELEEVAT
jgi:hypothetical protein